jgi:hypothetical protein
MIYKWLHVLQVRKPPEWFLLLKYKNTLLYKLLLSTRFLLDTHKSFFFTFLFLPFPYALLVLIIDDGTDRQVPVQIAVIKGNTTVPHLQC